MKINSTFVLNRYNSLRWCQESHEIAKYSPACYDAHGVCSRNDWSSFYDINKKNRETVLSIKEYLKVESNYVKTVVEVIKNNQLRYLTIGYLEKSTFRAAVFENDLSDQAELELFFNECHTGMRISVSDKKLVLLLKLCLREKMWCILVNFAKKFELSFGYEYYLILHTTIPYEKLREIVERNHLYLNARSASATLCFRGQL